MIIIVDDVMLCDCCTFFLNKSIFTFISVHSVNTFTFDSCACGLSRIFALDNSATAKKLSMGGRGGGRGLLSISNYVTNNETNHVHTNARARARDSPHLHERISDLVVHLLGGVLLTVGAVEGEVLGRLVGSPGPLDEAVAAVRLHGQHRAAAQSPLPLVQGPAPDHHLHRLGAHRPSKVTPASTRSFSRLP